MKVGIFADAHYSSKEVSCEKRYNSQSLGKIRKAYSRFQEEACKLVICMGDLIDSEQTHDQEIANLREIAEVIQQSGIITICIMGNHDAFDFTREEFYGILGNGVPHHLCIERKTLIFIDACYFKNGKHYMPGDTDWTDTYLPKEEVLRLKKTLHETKNETYIFMHQNIDPTVRVNHRLGNADEVIQIIEKSNVVKAVFQGHYHPGKRTVQNGVEYITFPAMCEMKDGYYIINL